jgi:integrase
MNRQQRPITDRELRAWLAAGAVDRGVGEGLTFVASATAAQAGKASWILRYRLNGRSKEKVLGRYPELSLRDARERVRQDRAQIERGIDVAAAKQAEKALILEVPTVQRLGEAWLKRYIQPRYKHPEVVARVLRKHIDPVIGQVAPPDVQPAHIDRVLTRIVASGAPTVANDALRYMSRMFRMAVRNHWIERNPAADFDLLDAGGDEVPRDRWLTMEELQQLAQAMRATPNFGRENELAVWLLLALCVRKMELLSARWEAFDLDAGVWTLAREDTKTRSSIRIPLAKPVIAWLKEAKVFSFGKPYVFPARRLVRSRMGVARRNRYGLAVLLVVVVAQPADDVDVRALAQVLGRVLGLLAPQRPLDRGGLFLAVVAAAAPGVADRGQHRLGDLAFAAVDEFELDGPGQVRVTLDDRNVCHDDLQSKATSRAPIRVP